MKKVLVGSPIRQDPEILTLFLQSLELLQKENVQVDYCFVDDNVDPLSQKYLHDFQQKHENVFLIQAEENRDEYVKNEHSHYWNGALVNKVANLKNQIIQEMLDRRYDYLFFIDSDLILHPETLMALIKADKDVISEIFWTRWQPDSMELPQVWLQDFYTMYKFGPNETPTKEEAARRQLQFIQMLRVPGVYEVGGLGALTLIKRKVFEAGVNFSDIKNVSFGGEDRHFCIRTAVHGFGMFVDTHYPAFHIYRKSDLARLLK